MKNFFLAKVFIFNILFSYLFFSCVPKMTQIDKNFDWQGHRGCRGILPENSIQGFLKAIDLGVTTLELDLAVSLDSELVVSHEPWLNVEICQNADGSALSTQENGRFDLFKMRYETIKTYDCGSKGNARFPEQQAQKAYKPTLNATIEAVKKHCEAHQKAFPQLNIELKSRPSWDGKLTPPIADFVSLVIEVIEKQAITKNVCIQSFDPRAVEQMHALRPELKIAFLVENIEGVETNLKRLTFKPNVYSPYFGLLRKKDIINLHKQGIKVIPWTVNEIADMQRLIRWGVDGIITDYPNRIIEIDNKK